MNPVAAAALTEAFLEHRECFGVAVEINGVEVLAVVSESAFSRDLLDGGFAADGEVNLKLLLSELGTMPENGHAAIYQERPFNVSAVASQPGSDIIELRLRPSRGR